MGRVTDACPKVFLLSPANANGPRAQMLLNSRADFDLAVRFRAGQATLAQLFSFISGLYFRGKVAYADRFASPPVEAPGAFVITPDSGLRPLDSVLSLDEFRSMGQVSIDVNESRYVDALETGARRLRDVTGPECPVILLGSIATPKYVDPLLKVFGQQLRFPQDFIGRGDMSRGGLMLRSARSGTELAYVPVSGAVRRGQRPARLPRI